MSHVHANLVFFIFITPYMFFTFHTIHENDLIHGFTNGTEIVMHDLHVIRYFCL